MRVTTSHALEGAGGAPAASAALPLTTLTIGKPVLANANGASAATALHRM
jgi:hypothetical protein